MANKNMFLFWGSGSAPCWKAMLALAEKGLWKGCPNKLISFDNEEYKGEDVMLLNPRAQVPAFKDGDVVVNESTAICLYIEDRYSSDSNRLVPTNPTDRGAVYQKLIESNNMLTNVVEPLPYYVWYNKEEDWDRKLLSERIENAKKELGFWNNTLKGKQYLCGDNYTLADVCFFPWLAVTVRAGATLLAFPDLKAYYERVSQRPSVQETWPPHWREKPGKPFIDAL